MTQTQPRSEARRLFDAPTRIALVESDLDEVDRRHDSLVEELRGIKQVLVGILVSVVTAVIIASILGITGRS